MFVYINMQKASTVVLQGFGHVATDHCQAIWSCVNLASSWCGGYYYTDLCLSAKIPLAEDDFYDNIL